MMQTSFAELPDGTRAGIVQKASVVDRLDMQFADGCEASINIPSPFTSSVFITVSDEGQRERGSTSAPDCLYTFEIGQPRVIEGPSSLPCLESLS